MSIPTNRLQQLTSVLGTDSVLLDSAAGTARISVANLAQHIRPGQNLLDNWYFLDPNNQRGQTEYDETHLTAVNYFIDRWLTSGGITAEVTSEGLRLVTKEAIGYRFICQRLEPALLAYLRGKTVTVSCLAKGSGTIWIGNVNLGVIKPLSQEMGVNSYTFTWPKSADKHRDCPMFGFTEDNKGAATLCAMKLELGSVQTLAHQDASGNWVLNDPPPNKALELTKCQRYFWHTNLAPNGHTMLPIGMGYTQNVLIVIVQLPTTMRPGGSAAVVYDPGTRFVAWNPADETYTNSTHSITNVVVDQFLGSSVLLKLTTTGLTPGKPYFCQTKGGYIALDRNL